LINTRYRQIVQIGTIISLFTLAGCLSEVTDEQVSGSGSISNGSTNTAGNTAPTISGNPPAAVKAGEHYSFTPDVSDPDGDSLTFIIENKPGWANFNVHTGHLSGVPTLGDIGSSTNIRISVSDGQATVSMSGFAIDVTQTATASTTLSWTAPTENEDGTTLTDLAGYKIYYGKSSGNYFSSIHIDNPGITTYMIENLSPDTYFFAATAFNSAGVESRYSEEARRVLN